MTDRVMTSETSPTVVNVRVGLKERDGWFVATCEELPGFYLVHQSRKEIIKDMPEAIRVLVKAQYHEDVKVVPIFDSFDRTGRQNIAPDMFTDRKTLPWAAIVDNDSAVMARA